MTEYIVIDDKRDIALYSSLKQICKDYGLKYSTVQKGMFGRTKEYFLKRSPGCDTELIIIHKCEKVKVKGRDQNFNRRKLSNL